MLLQTKAWHQAWRQASLLLLSFSPTKRLLLLVLLLPPGRLKSRVRFKKRSVEKRKGPGMKRNEGLTLVSLMVVIGVVAVLAFLATVILPKVLTKQRLRHCLDQVNGIGKALAMYGQSNGPPDPMLHGTGWDTVPDGTNYLSTAGPTGAGSGWDVSRSVSSLLFLLVRDGQSTRIFCCPSDSGVTPDLSPVSSGPNPAYNWDFSSGQSNGGTIGSDRNLSYSYQCPLFAQGTAPPRWSGGVPLGADPGLVVLADRTPVPSPTAPAGGVFTGSARLARPLEARASTGKIGVTTSARTTAAGR